jgi:hypothetical protein
MYIVYVGAYNSLTRGKWYKTIKKDDESGLYYLNSDDNTEWCMQYMFKTKQQLRKETLNTILDKK